jgi:hypothetical protein
MPEFLSTRLLCPASRAAPTASVWYFIVRNCTNQLVQLRKLTEDCTHLRNRADVFRVPRAYAEKDTALGESSEGQRSSVPPTHGRTRWAMGRPIVPSIH